LDDIHVASGKVWISYYRIHKTLPQIPQQNHTLDLSRRYRILDQPESRAADISQTSAAKAAPPRAPQIAGATIAPAAGVLEVLDDPEVTEPAVSIAPVVVTAPVTVGALVLAGEPEADVSMSAPAVIVTGTVKGYMELAEKGNLLLKA
jgi:hypothetical protein